MRWLKGTVLVLLTGALFIYFWRDYFSTRRSEESLRKLEILIDWQAEPTYLGIYYARTIGAFKKLGFDVEIIQSWGANQAVAAIAGRQYRIGTASGGATVLARNRGADVLSLAVLYKKIPTVVYGLSQNSVKRASDLYGKRIGIYPGSITKNEFDAFVKVNGLDGARLDVVSISGADLPLLLDRKVDAVLHYTEMAPVRARLNPDVTKRGGVFELRLAEHGVSGYGLNVITSRAEYFNNAKELTDIAGAIVEGYRAGCASQTQSVAAFANEFPAESKEYIAMSWSRVCELVGTDAGIQTLPGWQETTDVYRQLGLLTVEVDARTLMPMPNEVP